MPNHTHGIIAIANNDRRGEVSSPILKRTGSLQKVREIIIKGGATPPLHKRTLGQIIAYFKYQSTKKINQIRNTPGMPIWQRNYYEHIIRNENELNSIREYIRYNPLKWDEDEENPDNKRRCDS
jgi:REP element-mobilizing transposase RayT